MIATVKALDEKRVALGMQMRQMVEEAGENGFTAEQSAKFDEMDKDYERMKSDVARMARIEQMDLHRHEAQDRDLRSAYEPNPKNAANKVTANDEDLARRAWFLGRKATPEMVRAAEKCGMTTGDRTEWHLRLADKAPRNHEEFRKWEEEQFVTRATTTAQSITTTGGGHTIQNEAMREMEWALLEAGGVRQCGAEIWRTGTGATMPVPTVNDTANKSVILNINTAADVEALVFGQKTLSAYMFSTSIVLVPLQLVMDTTIPLGATIGRAFAERAIKGTNAYFTTGTGSSQPQGIVTAAEAGTTTSDVNAVTYGNLVDQVHLIDPMFRRDPSCGWMMTDSTLKVVKKLTDGQSRPLWLPALSGLAGGFPDYLLGHRITINQDMASIASATTGAGAAKAFLFGAFNRFKIRDVKDLTIINFQERFMEKLQVGYLGYHRHDSAGVVASTDTPPFKYAITKAT